MREVEDQQVSNFCLGFLLGMYEERLRSALFLSWCRECKEWAELDE